MTCTICGKSTGPGAMLCRPCKAALKRARNLTVQDFPGTPPSVTMPGDLLPVGRIALPPTVRSTRSAPLSDMRRRWLLAGLAIALLAAAVYVGTRGIAAQRAAREQAAAVPQAERPAADPVPAVTPTAPDAVDASGTAEFAPGTPAQVLVSDRAHAGQSAPQAPIKAVRVARAPPVAVALPVAPLPDVRATLAEAQPAPAVAPPSAPPAPDRWQMMAESLARCADEGGLSGFFCDQRVRLQSCDGYWGRVAQCPGFPENPR